GGNGSSPLRFSRARPYLEERFRPVVVEMAGQGSRSRAALPNSFDGFVEDLVDELRQAAVGEKVLGYGHGIGGLLLSHGVRRSPGLVSRLILHAPVGADLLRRRVPSLLAWRPIGALARAFLGSPLLGPVVSSRLFEASGAVRRKDRLAFASGYRQ